MSRASDTIAKHPLRCCSFILLVLVLLLESIHAAVELNEMVCNTLPEDESSIICSFRVAKKNKSSSSSSSSSEPHTTTLEHCSGESCVQIQATVSSNSDPTKIKEDLIAPLNSDDQSSTEVFIPPPRGADGSVTVGAATYSPPFAQYGARIAQWIETMLPSYTNAHKIEWANWYYQLGQLHEQQATAGSDLDSESLELALNAYRQSLNAISSSYGTALDFEEELFVGGLHFAMGEVLSRDPTGSNYDLALKEYQAARDIFEKLNGIQEIPPPKLGAPPIDRVDIHLRWANACVRISTLLVTKAGNDLVSQYDEASASSGNLEDWTASTLSGSTVNTEAYQRELKQAESLLLQAIEVYRTAIQDNSHGSSDEKSTKMALVTALQSYVSVAAGGGGGGGAGGDMMAAMVMDNSPKLKKILPYSTEALGLLQEIFPLYPAGSIEHDTCIYGIGDNLISLADTTLQLGQYEESTLYYQQAMEWYEKYNLNSREVMPQVQLGDDESILEQYLETLRTYKSQTQGKRTSSPTKPASEIKPDMPNSGASGAFYIPHNDGYEADLQAAIGGIYLSTGQTERSIAYFEKAIQLYETLGAESRSRQVADVKLNLAMAYLYDKNFEESAHIRQEALETYRELYGDGVNPIAQGLEEQYGDLLQNFGGSAAATKAGTDKDVDRDNTDETGQQRPIQIDYEQLKASIENITSEVEQKMKATKEEL